MVRDTDDRDSNSSDRFTLLSRRNVLRTTGAGAGLAALVGLSIPGTGQEDDEGAGNGEDGDGGDEEDQDFLVDDLIDPVFGYPLAEGETDDANAAHAVDMLVQEGDAVHEDFPREPMPAGPEGPEGGDDETPQNETEGVALNETENATQNETENATQNETMGPGPGPAGGFVEVPVEAYFDPVGLHVEVGEPIQFETVSGLHTVTAFHEKFVESQLDIPTRVPEGTPAFTSPPVTTGESWLYLFTTSGVYDLFCFPHLGLGMVMRVVVSDPDEDQEFDEPTAEIPFRNAELVLEAPELDPESIVDAEEVAWDELTIDAEAVDEDEEEEEAEALTFETELSGDEQVPPVDTDATGEATVEVDEDREELEYEVTVEDIENVVAAHIHCGPEGENGPVGVTLYEGEPVSEDGVLTEGSASEPDEDNGCGWETIEDVVEEMEAGDTYVNVHTEENPPGEIRGQL